MQSMARRFLARIKYIKCIDNLLLFKDSIHYYNNYVRFGTKLKSVEIIKTATF
jgi:hypothetical protein